MKKLVYILIAALLAMTFAGCGPKQGNVQPNDAPQDAAQTDNTQKETKFARGSWSVSSSGTVFSSDYSGIKITLAGDYYSLTDEELAENYLNDASIDLANADFEKMTTIPECAFADLSGNNCGLLYENVAAEGAAGIDEDSYLDIATKSMDGVTGKYDLTLSGIQFRAVDRKTDSSGSALTQVMAVKNMNGYMLIVVFTAYDMEDVEEMKSFFN